MGVEELAEYLGVPVQTVYDWRVAGTAPRAFKFGKRLKFAVSDVQSWLAAPGDRRMTRQRLPIGSHGAITVMNLPDGRI
jgi:excisionase family DNA binding protein